MGVVGSLKFPQVMQCKTGPTPAALVWTRRSLACDSFKALETITSTPVAITMSSIGAFDLVTAKAHQREIERERDVICQFINTSFLSDRPSVMHR